MRRTSLAEAKSHLSAIVDAAEHRHQKILILRHGKPAAAIVPIAAVAQLERRQPALLPSEIESLFNALGKGDLKASAVEQLSQARR